MNRGNVKENEMAGFRSRKGEWIELPSDPDGDGWYRLSESLKCGLFGSGPHNDHDRLRFRVLNKEDRAQVDSRAHELFVRGPGGELPSIAFCWRTALDETYAAKGVVMKLRRRERGLSDPILVPAPGAHKVCASCGRPVVAG